MKVNCNLPNKTQEFYELAKLFENHLDKNSILEINITKNIIILKFVNKYIKIEKNLVCLDTISIKREIYTILSTQAAVKLPWGILTGVRPTKIVQKLLKEGQPVEKIEQTLRHKYLISDNKARLAIEVALVAKQILDKNKATDLSLYINIPFCPSRCSYCSFPSFTLTLKQHKVDDYLTALATEISAITNNLDPKYQIKNIYIGGGTPTSLSAKQLQFLMAHIDKNVDMSSVTEYTVEAGRPETITAEKLAIFKKYHVDRISINPQTFTQNTLDLIGRNHNVKDIYTAVDLVRKIGNFDINMDIILGLPNETINNITHTITKLADLSPENITIHTMAIKSASALRQQNYKADESAIKAMIDFSQQQMIRMGYRPYYMYRQKNILGNFENVGYAKPNKTCIYNVQIIEEAQTILALGAGASSKFIATQNRFINVKGIEEYIARIDEMISKKQSLLLGG
ncbi:coproporphyrinogen dehydrogenase HemZ [Candidatus Epulonipiscium viviparus]|uniref:coproporphyrinogen dehydrogenase HemZ n=1 Tax=Candidatus Epulonipiscium viviparus TaxID=420336 RepID=UPI000497F335|nr:coproporphyrinogen dehydrogenase HemZ [Candidatus Epulopiscium viviparus]